MLVGFQPSGTCESVFFGWEALSSRQDLIVSKTFGRWDTYAPLPVGWIMNLCSKSDFDEISSLEAQLHL